MQSTKLCQERNLTMRIDHDVSLSLICFLSLIAIVLQVQQVPAEEWAIPVGGNTFRTAPTPGGRELRRDGVLKWDDKNAMFSVYFHLDRPAVLDVSMDARVPNGTSTLATSIGNENFHTTIKGTKFASRKIGRVTASKSGYLRVDIRGSERSGGVYAEIRSLMVASETDDLKLDYVQTNDGNMFYWGRRGPSVHLRYEVPNEQPLRYAYSEITVPEGHDPIGSFYMANGFGEGYFGMQVNSPQERRVLFSVWSPFKTDNPNDIPEDQKIVTLAKGKNVTVGEFGNEGSGGQSFLVHPWQAGKTYGFLTEVQPDGQGKTTYTSWFCDASADEWFLIASFRRPKTDTHLRGFHSFLESFNPAFGFLERRGHYGNVWVCDIENQWHECTTARFSVDATGRGRHRLDFLGGVQRKDFFLQNCGFFNETGVPGETFTRPSTSTDKPDIDFELLPRR